MPIFVDIHTLRRIIADDILDHILDPEGCKCERDEHDGNEHGPNDIGIREFSRCRQEANLPQPISATSSIGEEKEDSIGDKSMLKKPKAAKLPRSNWENISKPLRNMITGDMNGTPELMIDEILIPPEMNDGDMDSYIRTALLENELKKDKPRLMPGMDDLLKSDISDDCEISEGYT